MRLFRVRVLIDWQFVLAENEERAMQLALDEVGLDGEDPPSSVVEYPLDEGKILPAGWQSEPREH